MTGADQEPRGATWRNARPGPRTTMATGAARVRRTSIATCHVIMSCYQVKGRPSKSYTRMKTRVPSLFRRCVEADDRPLPATRLHLRGALHCRPRGIASQLLPGRGVDAAGLDGATVLMGLARPPVPECNHQLRGCDGVRRSPHISYQDRHVLSVSPTRGPFVSYQYYRKFTLFLHCGRRYHCPLGGEAGNATACNACSRLPSNSARLAAANCTAGSLSMVCSGRAAGMQPPPVLKPTAATPPSREEELERQLKDVRRENAGLAARLSVLEATVARLVGA